MYKHEYQGGPTVEVLSCQGKDPLQKWKISGGNHGSAQLSYEKNVKGYAVLLEGSTVTSKMQLPKNSKKSLHLTQKYLIFQVYVPMSKDFSIELAMTDTSGSKRRVLMSTSAREISITPLHAKLNISLVKRDTWLNLCLDLSSLLSDIFLKQTFKCLDFIVIAGNCKVRKIFTMRNQPPDTTGSDCDSAEAYDTKQPYFQLENVPPSVQFSSTVMYMTQVITVKKIRSEIDRVSRQRILSSGSATSRTDKETDGSRYSHDSHGSNRESAKSFTSNHRQEKKLRRPTSSGSEKSHPSISSHSQKSLLELKNTKPLPNENIPPASARSTFSLIQLVDDMEIQDSLESDSKDLRIESNGNNDVFSFSSKPHIAHQRPWSASNRAMVKNDSLDEDLNRSEEDETTDIKLSRCSKLKESKSLPVIANASLTASSLRDSEGTVISSADTLVQASERNFLEPTFENKFNIEGSKHDESSSSMTRMSRKTIKEIPPKGDMSMSAYDHFSNLPVESWSESFDERVLSEMKKEQEEEDLHEEEFNANRNGVVDAEVDYNEDSFDASWSTWKQPPGMDSEAYAGEMRGTMLHSHLQTMNLTLDQSGYVGSSNLPSPPIVLSSERRKISNDAYYGSEAFGISDGSTVSGQSTSLNESDDEEMLDLMYDPCLNCYFDPKSGRYYELKG